MYNRWACITFYSGLSVIPVGILLQESVYYIGDIISVAQSSQVKRYTLKALCHKESNTIQYNTYNIYNYNNKDWDRKAPHCLRFYCMFIQCFRLVISIYVYLSLSFWIFLFAIIYFLSVSLSSYAWLWVPLCKITRYNFDDIFQVIIYRNCNFACL